MPRETAQICKRLVTSSNLEDFLRHAIDNAIGECHSQGPSISFAMPDLEIDLFTRNLDYVDLVQRGVAMRLLPQCRVSSSERFKLAIMSPLDSSFDPPPGWGEPMYHPRMVENILSGTELRATYFHDCNLWQVVDHGRKIGLQWMMSTDRFPGWEASAPLRVFFHWIYGRQNKRLVHAGTLGKNGRGLLLAGSGGSGKSGTVVGGLLHGLDSVGDDYVLLESREESIKAFPLFETLKQDPSGMARLGIDPPESDPQVNWQGKCEFKSQQIGGRKLVENLSIDAVLIPKISGGPQSIIRPISKSRAMIALAPTGLFQLPGERDTGVSFFSNTIRKLPCFELELSSDAREVTAKIESFLDRVDSRC